MTAPDRPVQPDADFCNCDPAPGGIGGPQHHDGCGTEPPDDRPVHEQVLAADEQASAPPWRVMRDPGEGYVGVGNHDVPGCAGAVCDMTPYGDEPYDDAHLIALYRTAAPVLARQVQAALALHEAVHSQGREVCFMCRLPYPCSTRRALTEVGE